MVKERTNSENSSIFVNSVSLEDVAHSETNDIRAQSVTSIHSAVSAEPSTPSYEDLQTRLEASNRNIDNIKGQQQQLLQLQEAAKKHLADMEKLREQASANGTNLPTTAPPVYGSVVEVQNDMTNLVDRMKNLTTFIHGQHELSAMLGGDGDLEELEHHQQLLEKLNSLKTHRDEMRNLITDLQNVNSAAEAEQKQEEEVVPSTTRIVPVERIVKIEMVGAQNNSPKPAEEAASIKEAEEDIESTNELIRQKMSDINSMKNQLKRLKDMVETVKLIEQKTENVDISKIGTDEARTLLQKSESTDTVISAEEQRISEKVRLLSQVTNELREQSLNLTSERDRIKTIKEDLISRKSDHRQQNPPKQNNETDLLRAEYEQKKKEYECLVQRLNSAEEEERTLINDSEDEVEVDEHVQHRKHTACNVATTVGSLGPSSIQSGSSRSYSMPPPMQPLNCNTMDNSGARISANVGAWRKPSGEHMQNFESYGSHSVNMSSATSTTGLPPTAGSIQNNPYLVYNTQPSFSPLYLGNTTNDEYKIKDPNSCQQTISINQLAQTQQILVNSVLQCNHLMWQQQKEINNLNNAIITLQERLLVLTEKNILPMESINSQMGPHHRALSEQPSSVNYYPSISRQYQFQQHQSNRNRTLNNHHLSMTENTADYDLEQHHYSSQQGVATGSHVPLLSPQMTYNNVNTHQHHLNNDLSLNATANIQHQQHTPIFMNHHNNNISATTSVNNNNNNQLHANNISNLLTAQHLAQQQQAHNYVRSNNIASASAAASSNASNNSALNNQVPPGNRTNNYLDNFRSYSRLNLLSTSTPNKSNEVQHQQLSHIRQQPRDRVQQDQLIINSTNPFNTKYMHNQRNTLNSYATPPTLPPRVDHSLAHDNLNYQNNRRSPEGSGQITSRQAQSQARLTTTPVRTTSINAPTTSQNDLTSDFVAHARNMNFTFGSNEQNKVPVKAIPCRSTRSFPAPNHYSNRSVVHGDIDMHRDRDEEYEELVGIVENICEEEIRRNYLYNTMKLEEFSKKFFQSMKEDIFRQTYYIVKDQVEEGVMGFDILDKLNPRMVNDSLVDPLNGIFLSAVNSLGKNNNSVTDPLASAELAAAADDLSPTSLIRACIRRKLRETNPFLTQPVRNTHPHQGIPQQSQPAANFSSNEFMNNSRKLNSKDEKKQPCNLRKIQKCSASPVLVHGKVNASHKPHKRDIVEMYDILINQIIEKLITKFGGHNIFDSRTMYEICSNASELLTIGFRVNFDPHTEEVVAPRVFYEKIKEHDFQKDNFLFFTCLKRMMQDNLRVKLIAERNIEQQKRQEIIRKQKEILKKQCPQYYQLSHFESQYRPEDAQPLNRPNNFNTVRKTKSNVSPVCPRNSNITAKYCFPASSLNTENPEQSSLRNADLAEAEQSYTLSESQDNCNKGIMKFEENFFNHTDEAAGGDCVEDLPSSTTQTSPFTEITDIAEPKSKFAKFFSIGVNEEDCEVDLTVVMKDEDGEKTNDSTNQQIGEDSRESSGIAEQKSSNSESMSPTG